MREADAASAGGRRGDAALRRGGLTEHVYEHIKASILDGVFSREAWLPVDQLAGQLDVSRQPVMDALKRLGMEGFVSIIPQVGCRIRSYSPEEIGDFYRLFAEGEALVAEFAASRATSEDVVALEVISAKIGHLRRQKLPQVKLARQYRALNRRLHYEIRRIARSESVTEVVERLGDRSDFFITTTNAPIFADRLNAAHDEHEDIIDAIAHHDAARARRVMKSHIVAIGDRLQAALRRATAG
ncbi:hypothetical protein BV497_10760 [Fulvimonas soli]|uniref:GntR family transcriptional regulator n=1 Tax=Fulvimonas soli TaxID=155197 RepID=A0A316IGJ1_9GAMM|nr:GntR family transcriptional regulator [Fulvimonas soli]TNY26027.1 hypothetical protein BV497_10760 [Fulvimonas soli]